MNWQLKPKAPDDFVKQFPEFPPLIIQLLYDRGLRTQEQIDDFFESDFKQDIFDPFLLKGMDKAVKRLLKAIKKKEKIAVYGDFDTDGVCASAIVYLTLKELNIESLVYIPDRVKENHGLNKEAIGYLAGQGVKLLITVDCASRDLEEAALAESLGMELIITDHHQCGEKLPKALAVVNYKQKGDKYPFKELAGAGVAYKLCCALLKKYRRTKGARKIIELEKWLLDLAAIATVADVMPLIGENRTIVKYGLGVLAQTRWLGLKELMKTAQIEPTVTAVSVNGEPPLTNLNPHTLAFVIGPRLNAAGRIDHADIAFRLLISQDPAEAAECAKKINQQNSQRQSLNDKFVAEAQKIIEEKYRGKPMSKIIFEGGVDWPSGVLGLVAGKLTNRYNRPAFIYRQEGNEINVSSRSIPRFSVIEAVEQCAPYLERFGGHPGAAGFSFKAEKLERVKSILLEFAEKKLTENDLTPILEIDAELGLKDINWVNYDRLQSFTPFGYGNPEPKFLVRGLEVVGLRLVGGNGKHLKMELRMTDERARLAKEFKAIGFNLSDWENRLKIGDLVEAVIELTVNQWNGRRDLEMKLVDLVKITE